MRVGFEPFLPLLWGVVLMDGCTGRAGRRRNERRWKEFELSRCAKDFIENGPEVAGFIRW